MLETVNIVAFNWFYLTAVFSCWLENNIIWETEWMFNTYQELMNDYTSSSKVLKTFK